MPDRGVSPANRKSVWRRNPPHQSLIPKGNAVPLGIENGTARKENDD